MAALGAQLAQEQYGVDARNLLGKGHVDGGAAVDDQQEMGIFLGAQANGRSLFIGQEHVALLGFPVTALARLAAENENTGVGITGCDILLGNGPALGSLEVVEQHIHDGVGLQQVDPLFLLFLISLLCISILFFKIIDPTLGCDFEATVLQALQNGDGMALVDLTGTGAALDGHGCARTIQRDFFGLQWQGTVIFQQHHCLTGCAVGDLQVILLTLSDLVRIACFG